MIPLLLISVLVIGDPGALNRETYRPNSHSDEPTTWRAGCGRGRNERGDVSYEIEPLNLHNRRRRRRVRKLVKHMMTKVFMQYLIPPSFIFIFIFIFRFRSRFRFRFRFCLHFWFFFFFFPHFLFHFPTPPPGPGKGFLQTHDIRPDVAGKTGITAGVRKGTRYWENVAPPFIKIRRSLLLSGIWRAGVELFGKNCRIERIHDAVDIRRSLFSYHHHPCRIPSSPLLSAIRYHPRTNDVADEGDQQITLTNNDCPFRLGKSIPIIIIINHSVRLGFRV